MNVVRLGVLWQGVVPEPGQVNQTYLDAAAGVIATLAEYGIYTIVDMHQDSMGTRFCGEGFPDWAVTKIVRIANASGKVRRFPAPNAWDMELNASTGFPSRRACAEHPDFVQYYKTEEATAAWTTFFKTPALWEDFAFHWRAVARALGDQPGLLGYELLNEPFSKDPFRSDAAELLPLYRRLHEAIRAEDNDTIVLYEPHTMGIQYGGVTDFPEGGPGGVAYNNRQAFAYHIYCFNTSNPLMEPVCDLVFDLAWSAASRSMRRVRGGGMLTEFGALSDDGVSLELMRASLGRAEEHLQSWTYWSYKSFDDITTEGSPFGESFYHPDGTTQIAKLKELTRPYAAAIAGRPSLARFDDRTGSFTLRYTVVDLHGGNRGGGGGGLNKTAKTATTVIFAHRAIHYPAGLTVSINPPGAASFRRPARGAVDENFIYIDHVPGHAKPGTEVHVFVSNATTTTCRCGAGSANLGACCTACPRGRAMAVAEARPGITCSGLGENTGDYCGNRFHSALRCGPEAPICCTNLVGNPICCPPASTCRSPVVGDSECSSPSPP